MSTRAVENEIMVIKNEMRIAMFSTNCIDITHLQKIKIEKITNIK
jgi:isopentenyl diphosphate isomerase/L-lactate dehydrogenase-like FMN-dependent dehydrogenase